MQAYVVEFLVCIAFFTGMPRLFIFPLEKMYAKHP